MYKKTFEFRKKKLFFDAIIFCISLVGAWLILKSPAFEQYAKTLFGIRFFAEFLAGALYTSFATSPLAVAAIILLAENSNPIVLGLLGGVGAVTVDLIIVKFLRGGAKKDLSTLSRVLKVDGINRNFKKLHIDLFVALIGSLIIASPLPDELGLVLLGESNLSYRQLIILTYILNTAGIMTIAITANLLI